MYSCALSNQGRGTAGRVSNLSQIEKAFPHIGCHLSPYEGSYVMLTTGLLHGILWKQQDYLIKS